MQEKHWISDFFQWDKWFPKDGCQQLQSTKLNVSVRWRRGSMVSWYFVGCQCDWQLCLPLFWLRQFCLCSEPLATDGLVNGYVCHWHVAERKAKGAVWTLHQNFSAVTISLKYNYNQTVMKSSETKVKVSLYFFGCLGYSSLNRYNYAILNCLGFFLHGG